MAIARCVETRLLEAVYLKLSADNDLKTKCASGDVTAPRIYLGPVALDPVDTKSFLHLPHAQARPVFSLVVYVTLIQPQLSHLDDFRRIGRIGNIGPCQPILQGLLKRRVTINDLSTHCLNPVNGLPGIVIRCGYSVLR